MKRFGVLVACTAAVHLAGVPDARAQAVSTALVPTAFTVRNLGAFPGDIAGYGNAINNWGDVVGSSLTFDPVNFNTTRPALFANHQVLRFHSMPLETPPLDSGEANAINDAGVAAGDASGAKGPTHAARFAPDGTTDLGTLGGANSVALGINNLGQIVGYADTASVGPAYNYQIHAALWANGTVTDLGTLPGGDASYAYHINDQGTAAGYAYAADFSMHAVLFAQGRVIDLGIPPGGASSSAYGINNLGQAVGIADFGQGSGHAALFANGTITDLGTLPGGTLSAAVAINNLGQAVGWSDNGTGSTRPVLFAAGRVIDLGIFDGVVDSLPAAINDLGQVTGTVWLQQPPGEDLPKTLAVLWTPASAAVLPAKLAGAR
jgi:probable HAF family extracellular repeat protein